MKAASEQRRYPLEVCDAIGRRIALQLSLGHLDAARRTLEQAEPELQRYLAEQSLRNIDPSDVPLSEIDAPPRLKALLETQMDVLYVGELLELTVLELRRMPGVGINSLAQLRKGVCDRCRIDWLPDLQEQWDEAGRMLKHDGLL